MHLHHVQLLQFRIFSLQSLDQLIQQTSHTVKAFTLAQSAFRSQTDDVIVHGASDVDRRLVTSTVDELRSRTAQCAQQPEAPLTSRDALKASQQQTVERVLPPTMRFEK